MSSKAERLDDDLQEQIYLMAHNYALRRYDVIYFGETKTELIKDYHLCGIGDMRYLSSLSSVEFEVAVLPHQDRVHAVGSLVLLGALQAVIDKSKAKRYVVWVDKLDFPIV